MEFSRPEHWSGQPFPSPGDLFNAGIEPRSPASQVDSLPAEPPGKPKNTAVGSLSLLQRIFPTRESNRSLVHCRQILDQRTNIEPYPYTLTPTHSLKDTHILPKAYSQLLTHSHTRTPSHTHSYKHPHTHAPSHTAPHLRVVPGSVFEHPQAQGLHQPRSDLQRGTGLQFRRRRPCSEDLSV